MAQPDDWHLHLRDGEILKHIVPHSAKQFARAIVMPNLKPPVVTVAQAAAYRQRILTAVPADSNFQPLMTLYLTDDLSAQEIDHAVESGFVHAVKLYPAGATTNSAAGVSDLRQTYATLERLQKHGMPLLVHGEVVDPNSDIFDREQLFIDLQLEPLRRDFPELKIVFEHITTQDAVDYVFANNKNLAATITPQHLLFNRNAIFTGGIRPHLYCLPVLKRETHRQALLKAATSGDPRFFLGTDSAPHAQSAKENACGCAGIYSAHAAIELYAKAFERAGALEKLEGFASFHGADFYGLPRNTRQIQLQKETWTVPEHFQFDAKNKLVPLAANENLIWRLS